MYYCTHFSFSSGFNHKSSLHFERGNWCVFLPEWFLDTFRSSNCWLRPFDIPHYVLLFLCFVIIVVFRFETLQFTIVSCYFRHRVIKSASSRFCSHLVHSSRIISAVAQNRAPPRARWFHTDLNAVAVPGSRRTRGRGHSARRVINTWTLANTWPWAWQCGGLIGLMIGAHIGQVSYTTGKGHFLPRSRTRGSVRCLHQEPLLAVELASHVEICMSFKCPLGQFWKLIGFSFVCRTWQQSERAALILWWPNGRILLVWIVSSFSSSIISIAGCFDNH